MMIDFLGREARAAHPGDVRPLERPGRMANNPGWTWVSKRIAVPPRTLDAILSVGLLGATGVLDIDGFRTELVPRGGEEVTNLIKNPGFELGDPDPTGWATEGGARRVMPGYKSSSALELARSGARASMALALPVEPFPALEVRIKAAGKGLRGAGGARATLFFLGESGTDLNSADASPRLFDWSDSFDWQDAATVVPVPRGAVVAVLQLQKLDSLGSLRVDDVSVTVSTDVNAGTWTPYHVPVATDVDQWLPVEPSKWIEPGSALDFSFLGDAPAGKHGPVKAVGSKDKRLGFSDGRRARFFGVQLLPPTAFLDANRADALADRLARSGVNLVRLGDLDTPLGPDRSLIDDSLDDTKSLDPIALARLDHLVAALKARGIYVALELQAGRRFRPEDAVAMPGSLPPGGGPASVFDPTMTKLRAETNKDLLTHVNPETRRALKDEPALAWLTLAGEVSLFDLIGNTTLPGEYAGALRAVLAGTTGEGRHALQAVESSRRRAEAKALRQLGVSAPIASVSHWRREKEFCEAQAAEGFDLVDDRLYWAGPALVNPRFRSMLWSRDGGMLVEAGVKRKPEKPYVVGQWCDFTEGVWASPFEAAEQLLAAAAAASQDWDALVRRGVFVHPEVWGSAAPGTGGIEDIFQIPEVANAEPHVFALWPHSASILLRGHDPGKAKADPHRRAATVKGKRPAPNVPGWQPERGRLLIDTPFTQGVAGWPGGKTAVTGDLSVEIDGSYGVIVASSAGAQPIAEAKRLLVTAIARVSPTGFAYVDPWKRDTADPGRAPLLAEPVVGSLVWKRKGAVKAYALDNSGKRVGPAKVVKEAEGSRLVIDGKVPALHWEMVVE